MIGYVKHIPVQHDSWVDSTNSKFTNILSINNLPGWRYVDYIYYFDADTNIEREFTEDWFIGDLVGGEHFGNRQFMKDGPSAYPYERNKNSKCYVPFDTTRFMMYYYGAFFGGRKDKVLEFCKILLSRQAKDKLNSIEPGCNDESYINHYFHYTPPKIVFSEDFKFLVSCKGGIEIHGRPETGLRDCNLQLDNLNKILKKNKNSLINIANGEIVLE